MPVASSAKQSDLLKMASNRAVNPHKAWLASF